MSIEEELKTMCKNRKIYIYFTQIGEEKHLLLRFSNGEVLRFSGLLPKEVLFADALEAINKIQY